MGNSQDEQVRTLPSEGFQAPHGRAKDGHEAEAADRAPGPQKRFDSSRCPVSSKFSKHLPMQPGPQSDPLLRMLICGLLGGISFHISAVKRGANCTDLGEAWLPLMPKVFLLTQMPGRMRAKA